MRKQVAYLGPKGTYAEKAAHILSKLANFQAPIFVPCNGLHSVIKSIAYNNCDAAVVPIENSVEGGVTATLDALWKFPEIFINKAIVLPIKHALISDFEPIAALNLLPLTILTASDVEFVGSVIEFGRFSDNHCEHWANA